MSRDGQSDQVEESCYPAVEGGPLVSSVNLCHPLCHGVKLMTTILVQDLHTRLGHGQEDIMENDDGHLLFRNGDVIHQSWTAEVEEDPS